jgi:hypothetical protein
MVRSGADDASIKIVLFCRMARERDHAEELASATKPITGLLAAGILGANEASRLCTLLQARRPPACQLSQSMG